MSAPDIQSEIFRDLQAGVAAFRAGRLDAADAAFHKVLRRDPDQPDALHMLGVVAHERGRPVRAIQLIAKALLTRPTFPEALTNLARSQRLAGDAETAAETARQAIAQAPNLLEAHIQLGRALLDLQENELAAESCRQALKLEPNSHDAQVNLGAALTRLQDYAGAARAYQSAIRLNPNRVETLTDFAVALTHLERFEEALLCHARAVALAPNDPRVHAGHASTLKAASELSASVTACRRALDLAPENAEVWLLLGSNLARLGRFDEAIACHRRVLDLKPGRTEAHRRLVAAGGQIENPAERDRLRSVADSDQAPARERMAACFALGNLLDKAGDYDAAFGRFATANRLARTLRDAEGKGFDRTLVQRQIDTLIAGYTPAIFAAPNPVAIPSDLPVFVVGMPRSGTTLTEQILASHALVAGAGELPDIGRMAAMLGADSVAPSMAWRDPTAARREAEAYLALLQKLGGDAARVTDKMPDNIVWLGLIARLYPGARVVICRRDPRDVGVSCYFQSFGAGLGWSNDLADCAFRIQEVERLWRHWQTVLPLRILELQYEALIADLEGESRRLIDFIGLPWDPSCLAFHETERPVVTASLWQVRQPLYSSSVGRWRHYRRHLGPLLEGLAGLISPTNDTHAVEPPRAT